LSYDINEAQVGKTYNCWSFVYPDTISEDILARR